MEVGSGEMDRGEVSRILSISHKLPTANCQPEQPLIHVVIDDIQTGIPDGKMQRYSYKYDQVGQRCRSSRRAGSLHTADSE